MEVRAPLCWLTPTGPTADSPSTRITPQLHPSIHLRALDPPPPPLRSEPFRLSRAGGYERGSIQACERRRGGTSAARYQSRAAILARLLERAAPPLAAGRDSHPRAQNSTL